MQCKLLKEIWLGRIFSPPCIFTLKRIRIFLEIIFNLQKVCKSKYKGYPYSLYLGNYCSLFSEPFQSKMPTHGPLCLNTSLCISQEIGYSFV